MVAARRVRSDRPAGSGPAYPSSFATASTRARVSSDNWSGRLYAFDTVIADTPAACATVSRVGRPGVTRALLSLLLYRYTCIVKVRRRYAEVTSSCGRSPVIAVPSEEYARWVHGNDHARARVRFRLPGSSARGSDGGPPDRSDRAASIAARSVTDLVGAHRLWLPALVHLRATKWCPPATPRKLAARLWRHRGRAAGEVSDFAGSACRAARGRRRSPRNDGMGDPDASRWLSRVRGRHRLYLAAAV